ncbi:MAG TPA: hypothetical protein P5136_00490 [Methanofastidiosum sp.]|nr:hypothetical protein [Methanofastidiosum sp.]
MGKVKCLSCGEVLESKTRHDFRQCGCENHTFVDGGNDYMRVGGIDVSKIATWNEKENKWNGEEMRGARYKKESPITKVVKNVSQVFNDLIKKL